ncbi:hypothetical protein YQE_11212, partial [Dendroctonus ponderosae]
MSKELSFEEIKQHNDRQSTWFVINNDVYDVTTVAFASRTVISTSNQPTKMVKEYTIAQVKEHNSKKDVWILIGNDIYDVTPFLNEHPGGEEVLLEHAGKNATEAFEDVGHSTDARERMDEFKVGTLVAAERTADIPKKNTTEWSVPAPDATESSLKSWIIPVAIGLVATVAYRLYFMS